MTALTTDRHTNERPSNVYYYQVTDNTLCYGGGLATLTPTGYVRPGKVDSLSPACVAVGRFRRRYDNLTGADASIDMSTSLTAEVECGVYRWNNDTVNPVTAANIRSICYVLDDQTVSASSDSGARGVAGIVMDVDTIGVWVATGIPMVLPSAASAGATDRVYVGAIDLNGNDGFQLSFMPSVAGTLTQVTGVLNAALAGGNAIVSVKHNGNTITDTLTIPYAGSVAGAHATAQITTAFNAGDVLICNVGGAATGHTTAQMFFDIVYS